MPNLPKDWTDDMNIVVSAGRSLEELVDYVLESGATPPLPMDDTDIVTALSVSPVIGFKPTCELS